ncbi:3-hydroxyacyl-CoA dehydrogenase [Rhodopirellula sp. JC740]|uniref:3-hydroxyacyl-CoA dehydrogenase n=1 Tax=Rhodopirellula halodulae TaxID=2894198 RepID=A0ABS8NHQ0_9BACT|nr:3-hydroxyacyl-CoA dehydrogenase [Rhodopirellula sp. JC740]
MGDSLRVLLVGAGVVGRAIATDHLLHGQEVWLSDQDATVLSDACDEVLSRTNGVADSAAPWGANVPLPVAHLMPPQHDAAQTPEHSMDALPEWLVIESIAERMPIKQAFFAEAETWFSRPPVLTSNTSTLSIAEIASGLSQHNNRFCGMHFFMPVVGRDAAEIITHSATSDDVIRLCEAHVRSLAKAPLRVKDAPGFVVNRMLAPYLNLAMQLLCAGVPASTIREAALLYGMPMSPLELIDLIGPRTAFDGGRVVWQAFPYRMDPSPLLPAMVKRKLNGVASGTGFYNYDCGKRTSDSLSEDAQALVQRYERDDFGAAAMADSPNQIAQLFAICMWRESEAILADGVADMATIDAAMSGGLGYNAPPPNESWREHIESIGGSTIDDLVTGFRGLKSLQPPRMAR